MKKLGRLYLITDTEIQKKYSHYEIAEFAVKAGVDIIQLRDKSKPAGLLAEEAIKISRLCKKNNVLFIINDRVDIAMVSVADGVHLGKTDLPISEARKLLGNRKIIGGTAHNLKEALHCQKQGADYIGYGHIYPTSTKYKPEMPKGTKKLAEIVKKINIPVFAIGGINTGNISDVMNTGVHGTAIAGAVLKSREPAKTLGTMRKIIYGR